MKKLIIFIILFIVFVPLAGQANNSSEIKVHIFTQKGCPHCAEALSLLDKLQETNGDLTVQEYDLVTNPKYYEKFQQFAWAYNVSTNSVPITFVGNKVIKGFNKEKIEQAIENCSLPVVNCPDAASIVAEELDKAEENPLTDAPIDTKNNIVGWIVIGVIVIGGGIIIINKAL